MLFEILQNIARRVLEKAINDIDNYLRKNRERGELKKLPKIINLEYREGHPPDTVYLEGDESYLKLPQKGKLAVRLGVGYTGKEPRYSTGRSKRLKEKFTFGDTGKDFMERLSLLAEERLSLK